MARQKVNFRLSDEALVLLNRLVAQTGTTKTMVIEMAIREMATHRLRQFPSPPQETHNAD
jgi:hypothetical protein